MTSRETSGHSEKIITFLMTRNAKSSNGILSDHLPSTTGRALSKTFYLIPGLRQFSLLNFIELFAALTIKHNLNLSSPSIYCQHSIAAHSTLAF